MIRLLGTFIVGFLVSTVAFAEGTVLWSVSSPCNTEAQSLRLKLNSEIRPPLAENLNFLIQSCRGLKNLELRLNSPGGSIVETRAIADILDKAKTKGVIITTRVENGDECDSNCVPLFAQGKKRVAAPVSAFMFHGVAIYMITNIPDPTSTGEMLGLIRKAEGLNNKWLQELIDQKVFSIPSMYWVSGQELMDQKSGFITELLPRQQLFKPYDRSYRPGMF